MDLVDLLKKNLTIWQPALDLNREGAKEVAAVAVCLCRRGGDLQVLMVKRAASLSRHPGEFSFPGGMAEARDQDLRATAVRETREELSLDLAGARFCGFLPPLATTTGFVVLPAVYFLEEEPALHPDPTEIERPLWVSLSAAAGAEEWREHRGRSWPQYRIGCDLIWGASGRILKQLLQAVVQS